MAITAADGRFTEVNPAFCAVTGYAAEELTELDFWSLIYPEDLARCNDLVQHLLAGAIPNFIVENRLLRRSGGSVWIRQSASLATGPDGAPQIIILTEDITDRKQAEEALRTSLETFRAAAERASDIVYEWDLRSGKVTTYGMRPDRLGGRKPPETIEDFKRIVHPDDVERVAQALRRQIEDGEPYQCEYRLLGEDGQIYFCSDRGVALRTAAGEPYKWVGLVTDITEKRVVEQAISEFDAIIHSSEDAIVGIDFSGQITSWNSGAERLLGYEEAEIVGQPAMVLLSGAPCAERLVDSIKSATHGSVQRVEEAGLVRKDGRPIQASLTISPVRKRDGQITGAALIARDIRDRKQVEEQLAYLASHDHLTGLANRLLFAEDLQKAIGRAGDAGLNVGIVYIDLDGFQFVNDTLGHEAGDSLLKQIAERFSSRVRPSDTLARTGGDEFMLIVTKLQDPDIAMVVAERLLAALKEPFSVAGRELYVTASVGISLFPRDGRDVSTLRRAADTAMFEAKHSGKNRIRVFSPEMRTALVERLELESDLRRALDRNELSLDFQPMFRISDQRQMACEALARWLHPRRGFIEPGRFIPVAEETGLIHQLGLWVLEQAVRECLAWQERGMSGVRVAVNASALEFSRPDFVDTVFAVLERTGLRGDLLELELTESMLVVDIEDSILKMTRLRTRGVRISVDDFGTGYSSLGYLHRLPVDTLKIDRCFVKEIGINTSALPLIRGMVALAHSIGKRVVVEGVETPEQLEMMRAAGCDEVQGHLLGWPGLPVAGVCSELAALSGHVAEDAGDPRPTPA